MITGCGETEAAHVNSGEGETGRDCKGQVEEGESGGSERGRNAL
jgi:hypothetical protein